MQIETFDRVASTGQEKFGGVADGAAENHDLWGKVGQGRTHGEAQVSSELFEGDPRIGILCRTTSQRDYLLLATGAPAVGTANCARGDCILNCGAIEGNIPNLTAGWNALSLVDKAAVNSKGGTDSCSKSQANGTVEALSGTSADFASRKADASLMKVTLSGFQPKRAASALRRSTP